jgi:hypothetical protein
VDKYGTARHATDNNIVRRMRFACWITKAADTLSEYVILIAFPLQRWLRERASLLRLYIHRLSCYYYKGVESRGVASPAIASWGSTVFGFITDIHVRQSHTHITCIKGGGVADSGK